MPIGLKLVSLGGDTYLVEHAVGSGEESSVSGGRQGRLSSNCCGEASTLGLELVELVNDSPEAGLGFLLLNQTVRYRRWSKKT